MYTRADNGVAAEPYVVTDCDFFAVLIGGISANWMNWMASCVDCDIWCHLAVVTNLDLCNIQKSAIIVGKEIFAQVNVMPIVAKERRYDDEFFGCSTDDFPNEFFSFF